MHSVISDWSGLLVAGRYTVRGLLGEGGMGYVYHAVDGNLQSDVVIKVPRLAMLESPDFRLRFDREICSLVELRHASIVRILDVGEHDGVPFAVMEYLSGGSLEDRRPAAPGGEPLGVSPLTLRQWLPAVAKALDFVHGKGYIHRDIKPGNILFDGQGQAFLSDFGVAKVAASGIDSVQASAITGSGMVVGTTDYLAPEMIQGESFDGRVDQYALAVTVYEMLAGHPPFPSATPSAVLIAHVTRPPPLLSSVASGMSAELVDAVHRGLAKSPAERFPDCVSFMQAVLRGAVASSPVEPAPSKTPPASAVARSSLATATPAPQRPRPVPPPPPPRQATPPPRPGADSASPRVSRPVGETSRVHASGSSTHVQQRRPPPAPRSGRAGWVIGIIGALAAGAMVLVLTVVGIAMFAFPSKPPPEEPPVEVVQIDPELAALLATLNEPTSLEFIEAPLIDVMDFVADLHGVNVRIDNRALNDVGIGVDTPISCNVKGVSLRLGLELMLKELDLTCVGRESLMMVTTPEEAESLVISGWSPLLSEIIVADTIVPPGGSFGGAGGFDEEQGIDPLGGPGPNPSDDPFSNPADPFGSPANDPFSGPPAAGSGNNPGIGGFGGGQGSNVLRGPSRVPAADPFGGGASQPDR